MKTAKKESWQDDFLHERVRAEDILLGALGYGEEARIVSIIPSKNGYSGTGCWPDGERFEFSCEGELSELESWALTLLCGASQ